MTEQLFFTWFAGVAFATYTVAAFVLFYDRNMFNVPRRAFCATSCLMAFLAVLTLRDVIMPPDHPFFMGHGVEISLLQNLFTYPLAVFVIMELSHYRKVGLTTVMQHVLPFLVLFCTYVAAIHLLFPYHQWVFAAYIILCVVYVLYYIIKLHKSVKYYENELHNTYANSEGRALRWYSSIVVLMLALLFIFTFLVVVFNDEVALVFAHMAAFVIWSIMAFRVRRMRESRLIVVADNDDEQDVLNDEEEHANEVANAPQNDGKDCPNDFLESIQSILMNDNLLFRDDLTREDVAKAMGVSHVTMARNLKHLTGLTFSEYVCKQRLSAASRLLVNTDDGIEQILYSCGFRSRATFHRAFTKRYHCSPTDYRHAHKIGFTNNESDIEARRLTFGDSNALS